MTVSPERWLNRAGMSQLLDVLKAGEGETRFVGGCVRDALLGVEDFDVDLATRLRPEEVLERLRQDKIKAVPTGLAHGTITAVLADGPVEITTLRRDVSTDGRRATVAYTDDWQEDAARRDFTINALSADPKTGKVFDYFQGLLDLEQRRVRFIGDPLTRIAEDHLRILRFFRFHARFGEGEPDADAIAACTERANDLMALSRERIADELFKLLSLPFPLSAITLMVECGIFRPVLPEIDSAGVDALARLLALEQTLGIEGNPVRRLAALLPPKPDIAASVGARLRLSSKAQKRLVSAVTVSAAPADVRVLSYQVGKEEAVDRLLLAGDARALELLEWERPRLQVSGGTLIELGLKAGPAVAGALQLVEKEWAESGFSPDVDRQLQIAMRIVARTLDEAGSS